MYKLCIFLFAFLIPFSCQQKLQDKAVSFDRAQMLGQLAQNVISPAYHAFRQAAEQLQKAASGYQAVPSAAHLSALQNAWKNTGNAWHYCQVYEFATVKELRSSIAFYPTRAEQIEAIIKNETKIDETLIAGKGAAVKGLAAIEYLLFSDAGKMQDEKRRAYLYALTAHLNTQATQIATSWENREKQELINSLQPGVKNGISVLVNQMLSALQNLREMQAGAAMGVKHGSVAQPELAPYGLSGNTVNHISAELSAVKDIFYGKKATGLDDYLNHLEARYHDRSLVAQFDQQFAAAQAAIDSIAMPFHQAVREQKTPVENLYKQLGFLALLVQTDMASQIGAIITFTDNDGD